MSLIGHYVTRIDLANRMDLVADILAILILPESAKSVCAHHQLEGYCTFGMPCAM